MDNISKYDEHHVIQHGIPCEPQQIAGNKKKAEVAQANERAFYDAQVELEVYERYVQAGHRHVSENKYQQHGGHAHKQQSFISP
jgi:hypothetical protein